MPQYYQFGGQPIRFASKWNGRGPFLNRVASETRGLSDYVEIGEYTEIGEAPERGVEYLPRRASGPEPLDPGEDPFSGFIEDNKMIFIGAAVAFGALYFLKKGELSR